MPGCPPEISLTAHSFHSAFKTCVFSQASLLCGFALTGRLFACSARGGQGTSSSSKNPVYGVPLPQHFYPEALGCEGITFCESLAGKHAAQKRQFELCLPQERL